MPQSFLMTVGDVLETDLPLLRSAFEVLLGGFDLGWDSGAATWPNEAAESGPKGGRRPFEVGSSAGAGEDFGEVTCRLETRGVRGVACGSLCFSLAGGLSNIGKPMSSTETFRLSRLPRETATLARGMAAPSGAGGTKTVSVVERSTDASRSRRLQRETNSCTIMN